MFRSIIAAVAMLALAGCGDAVMPQNPKWAPDQEARAKLFKVCMDSLPAGPLATQYNDWDEVVAECQSAAYYQSLYCYENCPPARKEGT